MKFSKTTGNLAAIVALALAGAAMAQTVSDDAPVPSGGLDLPENLQIFGKADPNVRKPTAIVNQSVITGTDVDHRVAMIEALNSVKIQGEELQRLRLQVLRQLIDETLEVGSAKRQEIAPSATEIDQSVARVVAGMERTPEQMAQFLRSHGSSMASFRRQIEAELAWTRVQRRKIEPFVNVSDEEVKIIMDRLQAQQGSDEFHVKEIFLRADTPDQQAQKASDAQRIIEEIRKQSRSFEYFATSFSDATTRAVGGDLGWVRLGVLPDAMAANVTQMQPGQLAGPIDVGGGFSIVYLEDRRKVLTADPRDAKVDLRQITLDFAAGTTPAQAVAISANFAKEIATIKGCGDVTGVAQRLGAKVVTDDSNRIRDLPGQLQPVLLDMQVGQVTPPFGAIDSGVRALVLCGRDDARGSQLPDAGRLKAGLEEQRVNRVAQRMLRDLRRDAVIEYK